MTDKKTSSPVVYIFHGDDEYAISQAVEKMYSQMGDPVTADMNTTRLDGRQHGLDEIRTAAATMPFLAERRLVILSNPLSKLGHKSAQERFCALIESLPETAALVLIVEDTPSFRGGRRDWNVLKTTHWLQKWADKTSGYTLIKDFPLPKGMAMAGWIQKQAQEQGGTFSREGAVTLAGYVDNDTRLASQEILKLLTYVNFERAVEPEDVDLLTAASGTSSVFDLVDTLAQGQTQKALQLMRQLLEDQDVYSLFPMVIRQFRLLLQAREVMDEGGGIQEVQKELKLIPFVARKLHGQTNRFSMSELEKIYHDLLRYEEAIKTGEMPADLALEIFIAEQGN